MTEEVRETAEKIASPEEVNEILVLAADYLATRIASAYQPESLLDSKMRELGAKVQQRLTGFVLENYDTSDPQREKEARWALRRTLKGFWNQYHQLTLKPLKKKLEEQGHDIAKLPEDTGIEMVLSLKQGVIGTVAAALMARDCGWEVELPTLEEDVKLGKDLVLKKEGREVFLQVKCPREGIFAVRREINRPLIRVTIPARRGFFLEPEVGIPHRSKAEDFGRWLSLQLEKGEK